MAHLDLDAGVLRVVNGKGMKDRENGPDLQDIQEALGHSTITTTTMYAHISTRRRREKLAEYLN